MILKGGTVLDPASGTYEPLDILIHEDRIKKVGLGLSTLFPEEETFDCTDLWILPGLVDMHAHLREPGYEYKETIRTGTQAAAAGGFTTITCMANTLPVNDTASVTRYIQEKVEAEGLIEVLPIGAATKGLKGEQLAEIGLMREAGIVALSDDGFPIRDAEILRLVMEYARRFNLTVIDHCEDLITSIRLHAKGWKSVFTPIVVSRGLVPEDFGSFCKQQLKWSRGVFEVLFSEIPHLYKGLSFWQRVSYLAISTYYLVGLTSFLYFTIPFLYFWLDVLPANMSFGEFIIMGTPIVVIAIAIYLFVQRWLSHPDAERGFHWRGMILKTATWPVFLLGSLLALVNADIPYIPTAKKAVSGLSPYSRPLVLHVIIFVLTLFYVIYERITTVSEGVLSITSDKIWGMFAFAFVSVVLVIGGIYAAYESKNLPEEEPWKKVNLSKIKTEVNKKNNK